MSLCVPKPNGFLYVLEVLGKTIGYSSMNSNLKVEMEENTVTYIFVEYQVTVSHLNKQRIIVGDQRNSVSLFFR